MCENRVPTIQVSRVQIVPSRRLYLELFQLPDLTWSMMMSDQVAPRIDVLDAVILIGTQGVPRRGFGGVGFQLIGRNLEHDEPVEPLIYLSQLNQNTTKRGYISFERGINRRWRMLSSTATPFDMTKVHGFELEYVKAPHENEASQEASETVS